MTKPEARFVAAWRKAAADLGFRFTSPFIAHALNGREFKALGLVHEFGGRIGTLISTTPSVEVYPEVAEGYGISYISGYSRYNRTQWIELLDDWGFWGEPSSAPAWYAPGPNCHLNGLL